MATTSVKTKKIEIPAIVRTPTRAEGGITEAERAAMAEHSKLWIARAFRTAPIEADKIIPAIEGIYAAAGLKKPRAVIVPSPMVMAFAYGASAAIWHQKNARPKRKKEDLHSATAIATDSATASATDIATASATAIATAIATASATRIATDGATYSATASATYSATRIATDSATRGAEVGASTACKEMAGEFGLKCAQSWGGVYQGGNMWAPWECYLSAGRDILKLELPEHAAYAHWEQAAIHGGFRVMHPEFCMVSDFPEILKIDDQNLPHCEDGPSHRWRDGWSLYHWHGIAIPAAWIEDRDSLSAKTALTWQNVEQRRAACELVGWDRILSELNATTIDCDEDPMIGELVEVGMPDIGRVKFLRVTCGTGRRFAIPMPPHVCTALEGNAWSYAVDTQVLKSMEFRT